MLPMVTAMKANHVIPIPFSTISILISLFDLGVAVNLNDIDTGHDFYFGWIDINMAYAMLCPSDVLFGHDYHAINDNSGIRQAIILFAKVKSLPFQPHG